MLGAKLKYLRSKKGKTQEAVAKALGVSPQAISKWEQDMTSPDISLLVPIVDYFGVSLDYLLRNTGKGVTIAVEDAVEITVESQQNCWLAQIKNVSNLELEYVKIKAMFYDENDEVIDYSDHCIRNLEPESAYPQVLYSWISDRVMRVSVIPKECRIAMKK